MKCCIKFRYKIRIFQIIDIIVNSMFVHIFNFYEMRTRRNRNRDAFQDFKSFNGLLYVL